ADSWDMADQLRNVETPGYEGMSEQLPLSAAYSNSSISNPGSSDEAGSRQGAGPASVGTAAVGRSQRMSSGDAARKLPEGVLEGCVTQASRALADGDFSPLDLVTGQLERISHYDRTVRSYITVDSEGALATAASLSEELEAKGPRSPLH